MTGQKPLQPLCGATPLRGYKVYEGPTGRPIKAWVQGVPVEEEALQQLRNVSSMPFIHKHVSVMPDVHVGIGATIGSVIPTKGAIIPAAVGVDIGCGMVAVKTSLRAEHLPDQLGGLRAGIEAAVPHGRTDNGGKNDQGGWGDRLPKEVAYQFKSIENGQLGGSLGHRYNQIIAKHPKAESFNNLNHLGTLGTGNHFIELCLDEDGYVWVMLHSGSRGAGNRIGSYFIEAAKREMERYYISDYLPDRDLAYLVEHTELFDDYVSAVSWAQDFARANRDVMLQLVLSVMRSQLPEFALLDEAVNCHHNYISKEHHFGQNVWITRKGAVRARVGDLGIIPGSMGTGSFIVKGLGSSESFHSCSHGAGRVMSRGAAKKSITLEAHREAMTGIEARLDADVLDESPKAYKDIGAVMAAQSDLVEVVHRLHQILNVKG